MSGRITQNQGPEPSGGCGLYLLSWLKPCSSPRKKSHHLPSSSASVYLNLGKKLLATPSPHSFLPPHRVLLPHNKFRSLTETLRDHLVLLSFAKHDFEKSKYDIVFLDLSRT